MRSYLVSSSLLPLPNMLNKKLISMINGYIIYNQIIKSILIFLLLLPLFRNQFSALIVLVNLSLETGSISRFFSFFSAWHLFKYAYFWANFRRRIYPPSLHLLTTQIMKLIPRNTRTYRIQQAHDHRPFPQHMPVRTSIKKGSMKIRRKFLR